MESKEAIKKLMNYLDLSLDSQEEEQVKKLLDTIKKDLEVLEILKDVFNYKKVQTFIEHTTKEQWLKIKEWLGNEY